MIVPAAVRAQIAEREAVVGRLREVLITALRLELDPRDLDVDTPLFGTGLGLDSIDALELVVAVEHAFGVVLSDVEGPATSLRTVGTVADRILAVRR